VDHYLPYFRQWLITCLLLALLPFQSLFTESSHRDQLLAPLPSLVCSEHLPPSAVCSIFQFLAYYSVFNCFLQGRSQSVQGAMLAFPRDSCGNTECCLFAHLLFCVSQAGLELASGGTGALLFSLCNMAWRSFVQAGCSGCRSFDSSWWFCFCQVWLSVSAKFLTYGAYPVCFCPLVTILDPPIFFPNLGLVYARQAFYH
jgi:hypothetical protein